MKVCITCDNFVKHCAQFDYCNGTCDTASKAISHNQLLTVKEQKLLAERFADTICERLLLENFIAVLNNAQEQKAGLE